jgi:hypothetical protein
MLEEKSSYQAVPVTQGGIGYRRVSNVYGSEARLFAIDIPLLDDADDVGRVVSGFYWGAGAYGALAGVRAVPQRGRDALCCGGHGPLCRALGRRGQCAGPDRHALSDRPGQHARDRACRR